MIENEVNKKLCQVEIHGLEDFRKDIPEIVTQLVHTCDRSDCFDHVSPEPLPSREAIIYGV